MSEIPTAAERSRHPFRRAVLRGLGFVLPPLLTIVLFLWAWHTIDDYVLRPMESVARFAIVSAIREQKSAIPEDVPLTDITVHKNGRTFPLTELGELPPGGNLSAQVAQLGATLHSYKDDEHVYTVTPTGKWIPHAVVEKVEANPGETKPTTVQEYYNRYVDITWLRRSRVIPIFLCLFVLLLYFLGSFLAVGLGRILFNFFEGLIQRLPIIRNVYSSVKQVTDFIFSEQDVSFSRVIAVQYPRKGIWSIGFVTGESMLAIENNAGEPVLSVLLPTSPMPATGFTVTVLQSETIDLDISIDQAIQFIVSCGVVVPLHQQRKGDVAQRLAERIAQHQANS